MLLFLYEFSGHVVLCVDVIFIFIGLSLITLSPHSRSSSVRLVLVEDGQSRVLHQLPVKLLEFLQRVLVVLTGPLCEDIHAEVSLGHLLLVGLLVGRRELIALPLKFLLYSQVVKC